MRGKLLLVCFLVSLFFVGFVSSTVTPIHVKAPINKEVQISIMQSTAGGTSVFERFIGYSDEYGDFFANFSSTLNDFYIIVFLYQGEDRLMEPKKLLDIVPGEPIYIEMIPAGFEKVERPNISEEIEELEEIQEELVNESVSNESVVVVGGVENKNFISGFSINNVVGDLKESKYSYYFLIGLGGFIFIFIAGFATSKVLKHKGKRKESDYGNSLEPVSSSSQIKIRKLSDFQKELDAKNKEKLEESSNVILGKIDSLQRKLDDLQKSLDEKNKKSSKKEKKEIIKTLVKEDKKEVAKDLVNEGKIEDKKTTEEK